MIHQRVLALDIEKSFKNHTVRNTGQVIAQDENSITLVKLVSTAVFQVDHAQVPS